MYHWEVLCGPTCLFFFFSSRRRHTRLQGDWSSDVCSSDLPDGEHGGALGDLDIAREGGGCGRGRFGHDACCGGGTGRSCYPRAAPARLSLVPSLAVLWVETLPVGVVGASFAGGVFPAPAFL